MNDWLNILNTSGIDPYSWDQVSDQIPQESFKKLNLQPKNYIPIYSQKDRDRKLGFRENIWPFRNGIGRCVLIEGDMCIKNNYNNSIDPDFIMDANRDAVSVMANRCRTEREFLHLAYNSKIFHSLLKSKILLLGTSGKLYVNALAQYGRPIRLDSVQFELDWAVENNNTIALFEAKLPTQISNKIKHTPEFIIFQAYYPVAYTHMINHSKNIRFFFLDIIRSVGYVDYHFIEIGFENHLDLKSFMNEPIGSKTIRLRII